MNGERVEQRDGGVKQGAHDVDVKGGNGDVGQQLSGVGRRSVGALGGRGKRRWRGERKWRVGKGRGRRWKGRAEEACCGVTGFGGV